jgi:hypothetical protein
MKRLYACILIAFFSLALVPASQAQPSPVNISADENGNGTLDFGSGNVLPMGGVIDPGIGLFYDMMGPPSLVIGDVILQEFANGPVSDLIRFDARRPYGFYFFSDAGDSDLADQFGLPAGILPNNVTLLEGAVYHPDPNQPGSVAGFDVIYHFNSDTDVPDAGSTLGLLVAGLAALASFRRRLTA